MEDTSSSNNQTHHEATKSAAIATHPLQDVALSLNPDDEQSMPEIPQNSGRKTSSKENWVKFDDEVVSDEVRENKNNFNSGGSAVDGENATRANAAAAAAVPTTANRLSPILLPPPTNTTARPRTPIESKQLQQSVNAAPVQRATVSSTSATPDVAPAVLNTESTHVNLNASGKSQQQHQKPKSANSLATTTSSQHTQLPHHGINGNASSSSAPQKSQAVTIPVESAPGMRTIELSTGRIREGFANGDVIVTLLPANTKWPWITPAIFRPELVPEELMAQGLTLTVEDYVHAMETLVNDYRFTVYNICYKRILVVWILFAFTVLLTLLFSGLQGVALFSLGVGWLFLNAAAIFLCMWVKLRLSRGLEKCLARVNKQLIKHKILLILDDRGRISCHKVNLCFLYFDATQCVSFLNEFLEQTEQNGGEAIKAGWEAKLDIDVDDIVIQGTNPVRLSRKQERGMQLFLRYGSRWGMEALRGLVDVTPLEPGRHCGQFQCPCQYIKEHMQCKPRGKFKFLNFIYWVLASERYDY